MADSADRLIEAINKVGSRRTKEYFVDGGKFAAAAGIELMKAIREFRAEYGDNGEKKEFDVSVLQKLSPLAAYSFSAIAGMTMLEKLSDVAIQLATEQIQKDKTNAFGDLLLDRINQRAEEQ